MPSAATATKPAGTSKRAIDDARDSKIEKLLRNNGFTAAQLNLNVNLKEFDEDASLKNQARIGHPIEEATVKEYVTFLENGDTFPPLIAWERKPGAKLRIVDGNHRYQAYKQFGQDTTNVYIIIGGRPQDITRLSMIVNKEHGLKLSEKDRFHHALYLMDNNMSAEEAAKQMGVNVNKLRNAHKLARAHSRAERAGINMRRWESISISARTRLNAIHTDEIFAKMAQLVVDAGLNVEEINKAVTELAGIGNFKDQLRYIEAAREAYAQQIQAGGNLEAPAVGRQSRSPRTIVSMALGQLSVLPEPEAVVERMTPDDRATMLPRVEEGIRSLEELRDALKA